MGCLGGKQAFDALTGTSSRELCEAITDPLSGAGWYDDTKSEIGDICAWNFKQVAGYNVQLEWSNQQNKCVRSRAQPDPAQYQFRRARKHHR